MGAVRLAASGFLVSPVIGELHVDPEIVAAQERDDLLQRIAIFG
jgi:hypothetical protein